MYSDSSRLGLLIGGSPGRTPGDRRAHLVGEPVRRVPQRGDVRTVPQHTPADVRHDIAHGAAEDPGQVRRGRALGADAGREERTVDVQVVRRQIAERGADDRAEGAQRLARPRSRRPGGRASSRRRSGRPRATARCTSRALRVGGQGEDEEPGAALPGQRRRPAAASRSRGTARRSARPRTAASPCRRKVAAYAAMVEPMSPRLASISDQRAGRARLLDRLLQDGDAARAEALEERATAA